MKSGAPKSWFRDPTADAAIRNIEREERRQFLRAAPELRVRGFRKVNLADGGMNV